MTKRTSMATEVAEAFGFEALVQIVDAPAVRTRDRWALAVVITTWQTCEQIYIITDG